MIQIDPYRGLVWRNYGYDKEKRAVFWVSCPSCGPQVPELVYSYFRSEWDLVHFLRTKEGEWGACCRCKTRSLLREAIIPANRRGSHEKCTNRCLNGKSMCRCGCLGRCHSEGVCYCG